MSQTIEQGITKALSAELKARIELLLTTEIHNAKNRIEECIRKEADKMALNILDFYSVERNQQNIVITVKKDLPHV